MPAKVRETAGADDIAPGISGKPGVVTGRLSHDVTAAGPGKTADAEHDTARVHEGMPVRSAHLDSALPGSDGSAAGFANQAARLLGLLARFIPGERLSGG